MHFFIDEKHLIRILPFYNTSILQYHLYTNGAGDSATVNFVPQGITEWVTKQM